MPATNPDNIFRIKRRAAGGAPGTPGMLMSAELAYNMADGIFYVGYGDDGEGNATSIKAFAKDDFNAARYAPPGGTIGQVLKKTGNGNYAYAWQDDLNTVYTPGAGLSLNAGQFSVDFSQVLQKNNAALTGAPTAPTATAGDSSTRLATTQFVTTAIQNAQQGLSPKASVRCATTAPLNLASPGGTFDNISISAGQRLLVKNQTLPAENGIYIWNGPTTPLVRASDADTWSKLVAAYIWIEQGDQFGDQGYYCTADQGGQLAIDPVTWIQFSGAGNINAGNGLVKTGETVHVQGQNGITATADYVELTGMALALHNLTSTGLIIRTGAGTATARSLIGTTNRIVVTNPDGVSGSPIFDISANYAGQLSITTLGTVTTGTWNGSAVGLAYGGTGATTQAGARTNLGLVIGTHVQAYSTNLQNFSSLVGAANKIAYFTGDGTFSLADFTAQARAFLQAIDTPAQRAALGLGTMATQNANNVAIEGGYLNNVVIDCGTF